MDFTEQAHAFGRQDHLIGILTTPEHPRTDLPALLLLTAGLVGSTGPFRMYATIARILARQGISTFRMDLSGIGESSVPQQEPDPTVRTIDDLTDALDLLLDQTGATQFVVGGLCSGADDAHAIASIDHRVRGVIAMDATAYRNLWQWAKWLAQKASNPARIARFAGRRLRSLLKYRADPYMREQAGMGRPVQSKTKIASEAQANLERGVHYLCIFSGGASTYYGEQGQFSSGLQLSDPAGAITEYWWRECDHTYALKHDRMRLCAEISRWMICRKADQTDT